MNKRLPNGYIYRNTPLTKSEKIVQDILRKNQVYFEPQTVVFSTTIKKMIRPDFIIFTWKKYRIPPFYLEIDGDYKNLKSKYQILREQGLRYPLLRVKNSEIYNLVTIIEQFIEKAGV